MAEKTCTSCTLSLPLSSFGPKRSSKDGLNCYCRECDRQIARERRERNRARNAELPAEKRCPNCGEVKPASEFYKNEGSSDGLGGYCKSCTSKGAVEWQKANPERLKEHRRRYEDSHPERKVQMQERFDRWKEENPEKAKQVRHEGSKRYRERHPEKVKESIRRYMQSPKGRKKTAERNATEYYKLAHRLRESFYRAQKRGYIPKEGRLRPAEWYAAIEAFGSVCAYCGSATKLTIDHVVPISKGGQHRVGNVVPSCQSCNSSKGDRDLEDFCKERGLDAEDIQVRAAALSRPL